MPFLERFVSDYLDPLQVATQIEGIAQAFPQLCKLETLAHLSHGYQGAKTEAHGQHPIRVLRITAPNGTTPKPAVLLMRSQHAREWINAMAAVETARQLVENYRPGDSDPRVQSVVSTLEKVEFMIIAESNPDGALLSFFDAGRRLWRKNLRAPDTVGGCPGVDCNRNYPKYWGEPGSSAIPCAETYRGPNPLSEPESASIAEFVSQHRNIIFAIDSHSHGQAIFRPSPAGGAFISSEPISPQDEKTYKHLEARMNAAIQTVQGVQYATGSTSNHAGTTDEFMFFVHGIFGFDLECGQSFQPPASEAVMASLEVAEAAKALGVCASGVTGLPIEELLQRRQSLPVDSASSPSQPVPGRIWPVVVLDKAHWPRFLVGSEPLSDRSVQDQYAELIDRAFDVVSRPTSKRLEIIASEKDLESLRELGYQLDIYRDLLKERDESS